MFDPVVVGELATNCYLLPLSGSDSRKGSCIVIDPGADSEAIIARLKRLHLRPTLFVLTHGHFDHVAALAEVAAAFSSDGLPAPDVAIHSSDAPYLGSHAIDLHRRDFRLVGAPGYIDSRWRGTLVPTRFLSDGDHVGPFQVLHVPGHTPGCIALWDEKSRDLFSGDCLFSGGIGRTDLFGGDPVAMDRSVRRLLSLPPATRVYPGHGETTKIGWEH